MTADRRRELAEMSDAWLAEMLRVHGQALEELKEEYNRRFPAPQRAKLVELPCTLQDLETAVHVHGDHNGFHGKVGFGLVGLGDAKYLTVTEGGAE